MTLGSMNDPQFVASSLGHPKRGEGRTLCCPDYLPTVTGKVLPHSRDGRCPLALLPQHHFASLCLEGSSRLLSLHHGHNLLDLHVLRWATLHRAKDQCCASIDLPLGTTALLLAIRTRLGTGRLHSRHSSVKISL